MTSGNSDRYNHSAIEQKWRERWNTAAIYVSRRNEKKKKCYVLDMFPYPSGDGLHVGHPKGYIASDVYARFRRMSGYEVLHPMGWDAFGLPAEQYALTHKVHPSTAVTKNCARYKEQLQKIGFSYDWEREINTTDPSYYRWTQWIFLQMYKQGLAFQSYEPINWCPSCMTGLANEDLDNGACERCGTTVEQKPIRQWVLRITQYADRLLQDLDTLSWPESIKESQRNWIGRSEGALLRFAFSGTQHAIEVFTTRPDTLYGVTFVAISHKEYERIKQLGLVVGTEALDTFARESAVAEEENRGMLPETIEKRGMPLPVFVVHPITGENIPLWLANYVLSNYGTGAVMAVPAHDERDFAFASKYALPIRRVILGQNNDDDNGVLREAYTGDGILCNSGECDGLFNREAIPRIIALASGKSHVQYRLRDWVFARQRYWGEPIPLVHDDETGEVYPVHESELPVTLPQVESYAPTGTGESPLANIDSWVHVKGYISDDGAFIAGETAPQGKQIKVFRRETNTMPQWAGSSWYYLRYIDPKNTDMLIGKDEEAYWSPVDVYVGGAEHATRHLIYARFWHKFLYDIGAVSTLEPFRRLQNVGLIMASDGRKMSKRYGNVVNPDDMIETYGADSLRIYEMFMGPFEQAISWSTDNMIGARRFVEKIYRLQTKVFPEYCDSAETEVLMHQTIAKVGEDIENFKFNTAISQLMIFANHLEGEKALSRLLYRTLLLLLAPFAPHLAEELWERLGEPGFVVDAAWPMHDPKKLYSDTVTIAISINGKTRDTILVARDADQQTVERLVREKVTLAKWLEHGTIQKVIFVQNKIINMIIG